MTRATNGKNESLSENVKLLGQKYQGARQNDKLLAHNLHGLS